MDSAHCTTNHPVPGSPEAPPTMEQVLALREVVRRIQEMKKKKVA